LAFAFPSSNQLKSSSCAVWVVQETELGSKQATAKATAGPSTPLRFAQDDSCFRNSRLDLLA
ncbi:MAG TPA: hypothetical protein VFC37_07565, partial [Terracidiphilus sp.]|nr:hypothetical protein [Terracidiphilus sp.]